MKFQAECDLARLEMAEKKRLVYVLSHSVVNANSSSSLVKRVALEYIYLVLARNCRSATVAFKFPMAQVLEVGMIYDL